MSHGLGMVAAMDLEHLQRALFDGLYTYRIPIAVASGIAVVALVLFAFRRGWLAAARRHPARAGALSVVALAVALPLTWYVASPVFIRTELIEPDPIGVAAGSSPAVASPNSSTTPGGPTPVGPTPVAPGGAVPASTPFAPLVVAAGSFHGTDDFHFGRGTASIVETAPGTYLLRFADFSVRNGPDLFVYLSSDANDYKDDSLELGRLKATDGAFSYELPAGTDPAEFASAIVWCKQFSHLFAVAPFEAD